MGIPPCSSKQLIKALQKIGFQANFKYDDGSHTKITDPRTGHSTTVPKSKDLSYVRNRIVQWAVKLGYSKKDIILKRLNTLWLATGMKTYLKTNFPQDTLRLAVE